MAPQRLSAPKRLKFPTRPVQFDPSEMKKQPVVSGFGFTPVIAAEL